jgi:hypothetical protein
MPWAGIEPTNPVHALDRAATVIGNYLSSHTEKKRRLNESKCSKLFRELATLTDEPESGGGGTERNGSAMR